MRRTGKTPVKSAALYLSFEMIPHFYQPKTAKAKAATTKAHPAIKQPMLAVRTVRSRSFEGIC
jgi:hypothetical protein